MAESSQNDPGAHGGVEEVAMAYLESFASGDAELIVSFVSDGFVNEHTAALGRGCVGKEAYRERLVSFLGDMAGLRYEVETLLADGDQVAVFYSMTARWQGDTEFVVRGVQRLVVNDGRITYRTDYWDSATFLTQVSAQARRALAEFGIG